MKRLSFLKLYTSLILCIFLFSSVCAEAQELLVIKSDNLKCNDSVLVFTPISPAKGRKANNNKWEKNNQTMPTLFLLHGWGGCYSDWSRKYDLQSISNRTGFRIICPDGFYNSWYLNNSNIDSMQWRTFFDQELFPQMKEKYHLVPESTFITGLSMGGHGAVNLFLDHPENFRAAGSMSGVLDLNLTSLRDSQLKKIIGNQTERFVSESAITRAAEKAEQLKTLNKPIIVTCGYNDVYAKCTDVFSAKCRELDIPHIVILSPGKHSWPYWGFALEQHLWHFTKIVNNENLGY